MVQRAADAAQSTLGSVVLEFQGPACYDRVTSTLRESEKLSALASNQDVVVSTDAVDARYARSQAFSLEWLLAPRI